jgi:hypothetical protein
MLDIISEGYFDPSRLSSGNIFHGLAVIVNTPESITLHGNGQVRLTIELFGQSDCP